MFKKLFVNSKKKNNKKQSKTSVCTCENKKKPISSWKKRERKCICAYE